MRLPALWPLVWRAARAQWAALLTLGLLVLSTSFLVDAGSRTLVAAYDRAARNSVAEAPSGAPDLVASALLRAVAPADQQARSEFPVASAKGLATLDGRWRGAFPEALRNTIGTSDYYAASDLFPLSRDRDQQLSLGLSSSATGHLRYVAGRPPGAPEQAGGGLRFEAALPLRVAQRMNIKAGDVVTTSGQPALSVRITGLFSPADPTSDYWLKHPRFADAELKKVRGEVIFLATALVDPVGYQAFCAHTPFEVSITWTYVPVADRIRARNAPAIASGVHRAAESLSTVSAGSGAVALTTGLDHLLDDFTHRLRAARTLLSLSLTGLFVTGLGVLILAARLLLGQLRTALVTQAARGASRTQLACLTGGLASLVTVPAAAAGLSLSALFVAGSAQTVSFVAAAILVVTAIGTPAVVACRRTFHRGGHGSADTGASPRRLVAEGTFVVLALAGTYVLRRRGLTSGTFAAGADPFLSAVPALVAVATGLVILRVFPYPLRLAGRILARGRSAVSFVGVARASRQGTTGVLALVILLLAVALIGFGSTVEASLSRVQRLAAWQSVGGDARVDTLNLNPTVIDHVRHSPGVRAVVPAQVIDTANLTSPYGLSDQITVIGVDLDSYRRVMAGTPLQIPAAPKGTGPGAWALFSPALAAEAKASGLTLSTNSAAIMSLRSAGTVPGFPAQEPDAKFVLVPADALPRDTGGTSTGSIFVRGDRLDVAALRRNAAQPALGDAGLSAVSSYRMTLDDLAEGELGRLVATGFGATAFAVAGYGTLAVLVMLFAGAQARGRAVSYLRTLGLSRRQAHVLAFVEVAPVLLAASVAGWVLGLILPALLGPAIDLRSYTGGSPVTHYVPDLYSTIALTGGLLAFAGLAVLVDAVAGARRGLGGVLRIGDT